MRPIAKFMICLALAITLAAPHPASASVQHIMPIPKPDLAAIERRNTAFLAWIAAFKPEALAAGISATTFDTAFKGAQFNASVVRADGDQPEFERPIWVYLDGAASSYRIEKGQEKLIQNKGLFIEIEQAYGVPAPYITAIWGLESSFGAIMGNLNIIEALATLAFEGRRAAFGRSQLLAALHILENGFASQAQMQGSWAGGMGQTQFIPTTYLQYAVDHDKDGRRNLWSDLGDVFASTANYLAKSGWDATIPWGREISLPTNFDYALADKTIEKPVSEWMALGVAPIKPNAFQNEQNVSASLLLPAGHTGPAFLTYQNFKVILVYNNSTAYALAIGHLADRIQGANALSAKWPRKEKPLARSQREEMQRALIELGFEPGEADGVIGANTRAAIRLYQKQRGLPADSFATHSLLIKLRSDVAAQ